MGNFKHAFNVAHTVYVYLSSYEGTRFLSELECLALMVAAICHDLDHPGLNNWFQKNANTPLYQVFPVSTLEHLHFSRTMLLLSNPASDFTTCMSKKIRIEFVDIIKGVILSTDMGKHSDYFKKLQELHKSTDSKLDWERLSKADRKSILCGLMKAADICTESRPGTADEWVSRVIQEFFDQGDLEKKRNYPVLPFMDKTVAVKSKEQLFFLNAFALPLYKSVSYFFPKSGETVENHNKRLELYKKEISLLEKKESSA